MIFNEPQFFVATDNAIWYRHYSILFSSSDTRIFVCNTFLYNQRNTFPLFLYEIKWNNFTHSGAIFLTIYIIAFDLILLSDLNSNPNNSIKTLSVNDFLISSLDDRLMYLNISLIALKISKSSLSGSVLMKSQPSSCFIAFCLFIS